MAWIRSAILRMIWIILLAGTSTTATSAASAGEEELPRYRLKPGMVLFYKGRASLAFGNDAYLEEVDTTAWVVRRNQDGSCRVVIRTGSRLSEAGGRNRGKGQDKKRIPPMDYNVGYFDLFPDGRLGPDAEVGTVIDPAISFPRLPNSSATSEWGQRDLRTGEEYAYSSLRRDGGGWAFHAERLGPWRKVYGTTFASTYHFDGGMVVGAEQRFSQELGVKSRGSGNHALTGVETKDGAWIAAFASAADRFCAAIAAYKESTQAASRDAVNCLSLLADAKVRLRATRDATDDPFFREEIDRKLAGHDSRTKSCMATAKQRAAVVGKPSPDWSLQGLDGKPHALADYRGQVVVLDFWFRGCGWCVKAMPEMNTLAERFRGRPVAVLGMNTDAKEEDARFVADAMGLKYQTLRAQGIPEKYGVRGFPTVILIGPDGVVRDIHAGYSPTLGADLERAIQEILARDR
jgi:peroxiredoxin